jgi:rubrerythrin
MIPSQVLRELGAFWTDAGDALSIYFEPSMPSELSHREETIEAKETIQQAIGTIGHLQVVGATTPRAYVRRAIETIADMDGNHGQAKVIFASARNNIWREFDLPGKFGVRVESGNSFVIAPLLTQMEKQLRCGVALIDRDHERFFVLEAGEFNERKRFFVAEETEKVRTTGARKSTHMERSKEEPVHRRLRAIGAQLLHAVERGTIGAVVVGCREDLRAEIDEALPRELKQHLFGYFHVDPGHATAREVHEKAEKVIARHDRRELRDLAAKAMEEAAAGKLGAMGLADVAKALDRDEVRLLLLPDPRSRFNQAAWLCTRCSHLDLDAGKSCPVCAGPMRRFPHADEALVRKAFATGAEIRALRHASAMPEKEVGAWLRFRIEQPIQQALAS